MSKILISNRGNINGKNRTRENKIDYIEEAFILGFDVKIDIWAKKDPDNKIILSLNNEEPEQDVNLYWLFRNCGKLWLECKNIEALEFFNSMQFFNYFWLENNLTTITSKNFIWSELQPIKNSIVFQPENKEISQCLGFCSDYISNYNKTD